MQFRGSCGSGTKSEVQWVLQLHEARNVLVLWGFERWKDLERYVLGPMSFVIL